jgi:hypothetical protein
MKVGFTVMIQKQSNNRRSGRANNHQEIKKGAPGPEFNKESIFFVFFYIKGSVHHEFVPPNTTPNSAFHCKRYLTALRKKTSMVLQKREKNYGITVYILKATILKEMAAKIE